MDLRVVPKAADLIRACAEHAAASLRVALDRAPTARLVAATGSSQIGLLAHLTEAADVEWERIELFQLDEYIGIGPNHPASFCRFMIDRLIEPTGIHRTYLLDGQGDPLEVASRIGRVLARAPVDLLLCGVGENGHLAFNDPPADFEAAAPYLLVQLDEACRRQQVGEGWFDRIEDVPRDAISMSIRQIMSAREIVCLAYGARKARAIDACFNGRVTPHAPASILQRHQNATVYVDRGPSRGTS